MPFIDKQVIPWDLVLLRINCTWVFKILENFENSRAIIFLIVLGLMWLHILIIIIVTRSNYQYMMLRCSIVLITTNNKLVGKILRTISGWYYNLILDYKKLQAFQCLNCSLWWVKCEWLLYLAANLLLVFFLWIFCNND